MPIERSFITLLMACLLMVFPASSMLAADGAAAYRLNLDAALMARRFNPSMYQLGPQYRPPDKSPPKPSPAKIGLPSPLTPLTDNLADQPYSRLIEKAAKAAALDPVLVHAVIYVESRYRHTAVSLKGAIGLMQLLPETAARYGVNNPGTSPQANLKAGTLYLSDLIRIFDNRLDLALAAYNAGEGAVQRYANKIPPYPETQQYVRDVLAKYNEWRNAPYILRTAAMEAAAALAMQQDKENQKENPDKPAQTQYLTGTRMVQSDAGLMPD